MSLDLDITRRFRGGAEVRATLRWSAAAGSICVLFGPSGAGKTTVLRCLAGLERPDRGAIHIGDTTWFDGERGVCMTPQERRVGFIMQEASLFPHLSVRGNIGYGVRDAARRASIVEQLLARFGIENLGDRRPDQISGGQRQRVAIARALAIEPRLLLMDEPLASLDAPSRLSLRAELRGIVADAGIPAVLVTHDKDEALALGDHAALMIEGAVRQFGMIQDVFGRPLDDACARAIGVESVVAGEIESVAEGVATIRVGTARVNAMHEGAAGTLVMVCIHATDVLLSREESHSSARTRLSGPITCLTQEANLARVVVDCGFPLTSLVTRASIRALGLEVGVRVEASIKATNVHVFPRGNAFAT